MLFTIILVIGALLVSINEFRVKRKVLLQEFFDVLREYDSTNSAEDTYRYQKWINRLSDELVWYYPGWKAPTLY